MRPGGGEPDGPGWTVRVVPNKYPAIPGHEVVVHGPSHLTAFADVSPRLAEEVVTMWGRRRCAHAGAGRAYLLAGMNEGPAAGASLPHSHSQLVPFDHVPPAVTAEAAAMEPGCALCGALAVVDAPVRDADGLLTFCPPWGRSPYETWIVPRDHEPAIADPGAAGRALLDLARRFRSVLGEGLSWNVIVHDAPLAGGSWHWHAEVLPRITVPALIELGAGIWISTADPDRAGEELAAAAV